MISSINVWRMLVLCLLTIPHRPAPLFLTLSNLSSPPWSRKARKGGNQNGNSNGKFLYVLMKGQITPPMKWIYIYIVLGRQFTREKTKSSPSPRNHMPNSLWYMWVYVYKSVPKIKPLSHKSGWISVHCQPKLERISSSCLPKKNAPTSNQMRAWSRWSLCVLFILSSWKKSSGTRLWDSQLFMLEQ